MKYHAVILWAALLAASLPAPSYAQQLVELPPLAITGSRVDSDVTFDSQRGVYRYEYMLIAADSNQDEIVGFSIELDGRVERNQLDPGLHNNVDREETTRQLQPNTTIPVGIQTPDSTVSPMVNRASNVTFIFFGEGNKLKPGERRSGFVLESRFPPAWRNATVKVSGAKWIPIIRSFQKGDDVEFSHGSPSEFDIYTKVLAPIDLDESTLFWGGGQGPAEVNPFLRYAAPVESRTTLPSGTQDFEVLVVYGASVDPSTFTATLDGVDITSQFRPLPGVADSVTIPLSAGTSKLALSIKGTTSSGRVAGDADTLTFIVK